MKTVLEKIINRNNLTEREASTLLEYLISGEASDSYIASVLIALRMKGETEEEILGFIKTMRSHMLKVSILSSWLDQDLVDTCGTGGDAKGTFNISTTVAFVLAGATSQNGSGIKIAKHGNRSASSKCGSADVLESLGVNIQLNPMQAEEILKKVGIVFLFAPLFHPAMKSVGKVRKELGVRTVFNFLGPFSNPAGVKRQIIGVPSIEIAKKLSNVATKLGYEHLLIVSSESGMDEIDIIDKTYGFEIKGKKVRKLVIEPAKFGFGKDSGPRFGRPQGTSFGRQNDKGKNSSELMGGDAEENAKIIRSILAGEKGSKRDIVVLNAAYALLVAGKVKTVQEGIQLAEESIDIGNALRILEKLIEESNKYVRGER